MSLEKNRNNKYDVLIVGAGPAGTTAALALGDSNLRVALLDKNKFPRDKTCGDAIAAYVPKVLNTIHPKYKTAFLEFTNKTTVTTCRIVSPRGDVLDLRYPESGFICERIVFDDLLMTWVRDLSNVEIFEDTEVMDIHSNANGVELHLQSDITIHAALVIGCDGAQGICAKRFTKIEKDPAHFSAAVRAYYRNVTSIPPGTFELHFRENVLPGYFWIFPLKDNKANVGLGVVSSVVSAKKLNLRKEMVRIIEEDPEIHGRFTNAIQLTEISGYGLPLGSRKTQISGERFMLCGDAASLIDPVTGEGIGQAIISGRYAGWQAKRCFEKNDFTAQCMKIYERDVYAKVWKDNQRRYRLQRIIEKNPRLFSLMIKLAARNKLVYKVVQKLI